MNANPIPSILGRLRQILGASGSGALTDTDLLQRWISRRDEAAFETLVWRHGPAVFGLCRRLVRREQDAEDAFQATFLTLARKAASIRNGEAVAAWLHRVACRVALQLRAALVPSVSLAADLVPCSSESIPDPADDAARRELLTVLTEEVARLPGHFRSVVVLCHLEGRTNEETAQELGLPIGTVNSRLVRARERLRNRLLRRGLALPAGGVAVLLACWPAPLSAALVSSTIRAALVFAAGQAVAAGVSPAVLALTEGVIKAMWVSKLKGVVAVVLAMAVLTGGGGVLSYRLRAEGETPPGTGSTAVAPAEGETLRLAVRLPARDKEKPPADSALRDDKAGRGPAPKPEGLSGVLQPGERAIAIRVTAEAGVSGFVLPGSRVDVICTTRGTETTSKVILQNLRVLAVDQMVKEKADQPGPAASTVTLAAKPEEATRLALASSLGELRLALRGPADDKAVAPIVTRKEDLDVVRGSTTARSGPAEEGLGTRVEQARDEVELLEIGLEAKQALLTVEKKLLEEAQRRLARMETARKLSALSVNEDDYYSGVLKVETCKAQVAVREAELKEHKVRITQARRRLGALEPAAPRPPAKPAASEERLRELERHLDALRKEVEEMRRAGRPGKGI
jgi:RNA polymerase sigma factor (sigma-70 family)